MCPTLTWWSHGYCCEVLDAGQGGGLLQVEAFGAFCLDFYWFLLLHIYSFKLSEES